MFYHLPFDMNRNSMKHFFIGPNKKKKIPHKQHSFGSLPFNLISLNGCKM